jgi:hypothetical protein
MKPPIPGQIEPDVLAIEYDLTLWIVLLLVLGAIAAGCILGIRLARRRTDPPPDPEPSSTQITR